MASRLLACSLAALAFVLPAIADSTAASPQALQPDDDSSYVPTAYALNVFSEPKYLGDAVQLRPAQCTPAKEFNFTVKSIKFNGNNCCLFFPTPDCSNYLSAQRVFGNVRDVGSWGFPDIQAVKCLSRSACSLIAVNQCDLDKSCSRRALQGRCPFDVDCSDYKPIELQDWQRFRIKPWDPVLARYNVKVYPVDEYEKILKEQKEQEEAGKQ